MKWIESQLLYFIKILVLSTKPKFVFPFHWFGKFQILIFIFFRFWREKPYYFSICMKWMKKCMGSTFLFDWFRRFQKLVEISVTLLTIVDKCKKVSKCVSKTLCCWIIIQKTKICLRHYVSQSDGTPLWYVRCLKLLNKKIKKDANVISKALNINFFLLTVVMFQFFSASNTWTL